MNKLLTMVLVIGIGAPTAWACIHPEADYGGTVRPAAQEFAVVFDGEREVLLISATIASDGAAPEALSLVTATPSLPDTYADGDPELFAALYQWFEPSLSAGGEDGGKGWGDGSNGHVEVLPAVETGAWEIQPLQASGADGVEALNAWLTDHGFVTLAPDVAAWYADEGWYFLAVKVKAADGDATLEDGVLPPLEIGFETDELVVPLKMEAGMEAFDARLYLFFGQEFPADFDPSAFGLTRNTDHGGTLAGAPGVVKDLVAGYESDGRVSTPAQPWMAYELTGQLNTADNLIMSWPDDFHMLAEAAASDTGDTGDTADTGDTGDTADTADTGVPAASSGSGSSSGCSTAAGPVAGHAAWALLLLALVALRRRRRAA